MKTLKFSDEQFDCLQKFIDNQCESIVERSLEWEDSSFGEELMEVNEPLFELQQKFEDLSQ